MVTTTRSSLPAATGRPFSRSYDGGSFVAARGRRAASRVRGGREALLVFGTCWVALGLLVAVWPGKSVSSLEVLFGLGLVLSAGVQVFHAVGARFAAPLRVLLGLGGVLTAGLAVLCLSGGNSVPMLSMWLGLSWAISGIGQATVAVWDSRLTGAVRYELVGVATMLAGILVLLLPLESATTLGFVASAVLSLLGAANLVLAGVVRGAVLPAQIRRISLPYNRTRVAGQS